MEDVTYWIAQSAAIVQAREGRALTEEESQHLDQIEAWCKESPMLWQIIARIGWEINEG